MFLKKQSVVFIIFSSDHMIQMVRNLCQMMGAHYLYKKDLLTYKLSFVTQQNTQVC